MAEGATSSGGSAGISMLAIGSVGGSSSSGGGFSSSASALPAVASAVAQDVTQDAFAKGGLLRSFPISIPGYSLELSKNPYDSFSGRGFDRRQVAGLDYGNQGSQMASKHEVREQIYGSSAALYTNLVRAYSGSRGGANPGFLYPQAGNCK